MFISPVSDLLEGPEIIVVPDRCLYHVPFAAYGIKVAGNYQILSG